MKPEHHFRLQLLAVIHELHSDYTGTFEGLSDEKRRELVDWLSYRVEAWELPSSNMYAAFETALRELAIECLHEQHELRDRHAC